MFRAPLDHAYESECNKCEKRFVVNHGTPASELGEAWVEEIAIEVRCNCSGVAKFTLPNPV